MQSTLDGKKKSRGVYFTPSFIVDTPAANKAGSGNDEPSGGG